MASSGRTCSQCHMLVTLVDTMHVSIEVNNAGLHTLTEMLHVWQAKMCATHSCGAYKQWRRKVGGAPLGARAPPPPPHNFGALSHEVIFYMNNI